MKSNKFHLYSKTGVNGGWRPMFQRKNKRAICNSWQIHGKKTNNLNVLTGHCDNFSPSKWGTKPKPSHLVKQHFVKWAKHTCSHILPTCYCVSDDVCMHTYGSDKSEAHLDIVTPAQYRELYLPLLYTNDANVLKSCLPLSTPAGEGGIDSTERKKKNTPCQEEDRMDEVDQSYLQSGNCTTPPSKT